ncbi:hypothetical protein EJD97_002193 [Solanum chilense]|uniref:Histone H2A n=1 Tax=Solanum chilense TaxID=4083 RepID=A0A6N2C3M6_SOLCI|nr:hypothetical protein EJD97_002193 [Solanum chilense]
MARKGKNLSLNAKRRSHSSKTGLQFPIARIGQFLNIEKYAKRDGADTPMFLASVLEYHPVEVLEFSEIAARNDKKTRIPPRHI